MFSVAVFFGLIGVSLSLDAVVTLHCDNQYVAKVSYDGGSTYAQIASGTHWPTAEVFTVSNVTPNTILDVECTDVGVIGGFISTVAYDGNEYYTDNPITNSIWEIVSSPSEPLVYHVKTAAPWSITTTAINDNAFWVWNSETWNTMIFRFDFGEICSQSFVGVDCNSNDDCPDCLECCEGRKKCHGRTYNGDYVVPLCWCDHDVWADTYDEAQRYCQGRYGTGLPTIVAQYDKDTFIDIMNAAEQEICGGDCEQLHSTYIGLNDRQEEGTFVWADGTPCITNDGKCIDYWAPGQPDQGSNTDDCVWFNWDTTELSHDVGCHNENHIACNKPHPFIDNGHGAGLDAMNGVPAKVDILHNNDDDVIINKHTDNYNGYYNIMIGGFILFILINNIFVCYWCVCKNNSEKMYKAVKLDFNEEENIN